MEVNCELHPLMHTPPEFDLTQDVEKKKARPFSQPCLGGINIIRRMD